MMDIQKILEEHKKWINSLGTEGSRADLRGANLRWADLRGANLRGADLSRADLRGANLRGADLIEADLRWANLTGANLSRADLIEADLRWANLTGANLSRADLRLANLSGADLDFSVFPLWCGGLDVNIDDRLAIQLLYHLIRNVMFSKNTSKGLKKVLGTKTLIKWANKFHREDVDRIVLEEKGE